MAGTNHFRFHGTKAEIAEMQQALPHHAADRVISKRPLYQHMNAHLGVEIWELNISKDVLNQAIVAAIKSVAEKHPKMIWEVATWKTNVTVEFNQEKLINYDLSTPGFPGPFGGLCLRYGKTFY